MTDKPSGMKKLLVLDANQRSALAITRSLGKRGLSVVTADYIEPALAAASGYAAGSFSYVDPTSDPIRFLKEIRENVHRLGVDIVIPASDITTMLLVGHPEYVGPARLACPSAESYEQLTDKQRLLALASSFGLSVPSTQAAYSATQITSAATEFGYPLVLKPSRSRYLKGGRIVSTGVRIVNTARQLATTLNHLDWLGDIPCLVQKYIPGTGAGVFAICGPDGPHAWFAHRRLREKPPAGGVSVLSECTSIDPVMREGAEQLLAAAKWFGVAMIEFRVAVDGTPYLMEVNGRFWGSLQLAIDCGIDFPWLLYELVNGNTPSIPLTYPTGRRLRWLLGDVDNLLLQLRDDRLGAGGKLRSIGEFLRTFLGPACRQEVFRWSDSGPGLREARQWFGSLLE